MKIALFALKNPRAIIGLLVFLICIGIYSYKETPLGYYPIYSAPALEIVTLFPGAGAREVKEDITEPLLNAVSSLGDIKLENSISSNGLSYILVKFKEGVDIELLKIRTQEVVDTLHATKLPKNSKEEEVPCQPTMNLCLGFFVFSLNLLRSTAVGTSCTFSVNCLHQLDKYAFPANTIGDLFKRVTVFLWH